MTMDYDNFKDCPVQNCIKCHGEKMVNKKFGEFLSSNKELSTRMLALRLKELENNSLISRILINQKPLDIEYHLI